MWSIENPGTGSRIYFIVGEEYIVGRKECQILITGDQSISRKHACFRVKHSECHLNRPNSPSSLILKETSKFGTVYNGVKLESGSETSLQLGDTISFGTFKSNTWRVCYDPCVVAASALPADEKKALKHTVHKLGGHVVSDWCPQCTHLVMSQLNVTIKVINALVACRPIVTPEFFKRIVEAVREKSASLPKAERYLPNVAEAAINKNEVSFSPDEKRKELFKDRTFFFLTEKQFKRLHVPISVAGGRSELLDEETNVPAISHRLTLSTSCVLYTEHQDSTQEMSQTGQKVAAQVLRLLKKHKLRPIPESELGLAVIYISTALHCNPKVAQAGLDLLSAVPSQSLPTQTVLASDTQANSPQIHPRAGKPSGKNSNKDTGSTSNQPKQNLTSTPKISKISETLIVTPPATSQATSSRLLGASPEFSLQDKVPVKMDSNKEVDRGDSKPSIKDEMVGRNEKPTIKIKEEILSQPAASPVTTMAERHTSKGKKPTPVEIKENLDVKSEQPSQRELQRNSDSGSKPLCKQGTLDMFKKPFQKAEAPKRDTREKERQGRESQQRAGFSDVKEEPMDMAETEAECIIEQRDDRKDEEEEKEEEDPFHYDRKKPKKKTEAVHPNQRQELKTEQDVDGGKRSGKRRGNWSDENDDESSKKKPWTGQENDGSSMWKKKARIDVFSQEEEAETDSQCQDDWPSEAARDITEDALNLPRGFISARIPIEDQVNVKIEQDYMAEEGLPSKLIKVTNAALVIRKKRQPSRRPVQDIGSGRQVKNFKKFRKAGYAGQSSIPRIIGGNDLFTHYNNPSKDIEDMFNEEVKAEKKKDKQEEMAEKLFAFEPRRAQVPKRKR